MNLKLKNIKIGILELLVTEKITQMEKMNVIKICMKFLVRKYFCISYPILVY